MELNNWVLVEVKTDHPYKKLYYYSLVYIHEFNSVWTIELIFSLSQRKLVSPRIAEIYVSRINDIRATYRIQLQNYKYMLNSFDKDTVYFIRNYIFPNVYPDHIRIIDKFSYQISEKNTEKINYYLTEVV